MRYIIPLLLLVFLMAAGKPLLAQTGTSAVEQRIGWHLKHIQYWRFDYSPDDTTFTTAVNADDSVAAANKMLLDYLVDVCNKQPGLLSTSVFPSLENTDMKIVTSADKKLRFYSWDTQTGTGAHFFDIVAQYIAAGGSRAQVFNDISKYTGDGPDAGVTYTDIIVMNGLRSTYYLALYNSIAANGNMLKGVHAYKIEGDKLIDAPIFQGAYETKSKLEYSYDYSANYDFKKMKEDYTLHLDKQKLYIPEVANDKVTGNYMVYVYDGDKFVYDKNAK